MSLRYLLVVLLVLYVVFIFFIPAMQSVFGYGAGTLLAIVVLIVFLNGRNTTL